MSQQTINGGSTKRHRLKRNAHSEEYHSDQIIGIFCCRRYRSSLYFFFSEITKIASLQNFTNALPDLSPLSTKMTKIPLTKTSTHEREHFLR
jgi:hypothetical protein